MLLYTNWRNLAQYIALQEENKRRRDECIQLKAVLATQSQSLRDLGSTSLKNDTERIHDDSELLEAFNAQKLVNRQLEAELSALIQEHNARVIETNDIKKEVEEVRAERNKYQDILMEKLKLADDPLTIETLYQNEQYLRYELENSLNSFADLQVISRTRTQYWPVNLCELFFFFFFWSRFKIMYCCVRMIR